MTLELKANATKLPAGAVNVIPEERSTRVLLASNVLICGANATLPPCGLVHHPKREIGWSAAKLIEMKPLKSRGDAGSPCAVGARTLVPECAPFNELTLMTAAGEPPFAGLPGV